MMRKVRWLSSACGCLILTLCLPSSSVAQVSEVDYKSLYAAAEYDKALEVVTSLDSVEAQQYKALCLLALGRQADASTAVEALVNSSPTFIPSSDDAPPRFVELVTKVRQKLLPTIARRVFAEGRDRYTDKKNDEAVKRFSLVLTLLNDPAFPDPNTKQDLETLAKGFIDLATAAAVPVKVVAAPPEPVTPPPAPATPTAPPKVVPPVALSQEVPPMPTDLASRADAKLVLVVLIDETGRVTSVTVKESAHPVYDRLVSQATRSWRYTPATRNGAPIPSEQIVTIQVKR
ncbi:MAG TPA: TonB family protein [Vicinamibacterales bacterium]|jgi:TonB family protein|nr:TonB family protein [Vicinamibacterales bacterium]